MNTEIKVNLTIMLPGSIMPSKEECLKTTQKEIIKKTKSGKVFKKVIDVLEDDMDKVEKNSMRVTDKKGKNPQVISFTTRKSRPATQSVNICKEAYIYMTSKECPEWAKPSTWCQMNKTQRLEQHLKKIAETLKGTVLSYRVFDG